MLQYLVGPAAELAVNSCVPERHCQPESCPTSQSSVTCYTQPTDNITDVSYAGVGLDAAGVVNGNKSTENLAESQVVSPRTSSENQDGRLSTVVVDRIPVVSATTVPKKRGRKPKRRRRLAAALAANRPSTSTQDLSAKADVIPPTETTVPSSQPSFDNCNSVQEDVASKAPDEHRPAPKKRGRKPKHRPVVAVVDDVTKSGRSPLAKSPRSSSEPTSAPVMSEMTASTGNDPSTTLSTSDGNGNAGSDVVANGGTSDEMPRRRGRKRKNTTADNDDQRQAKMDADEDRVQSIWKVTSSPALPQYSGNVVPRIKVTNVRLSSESAKTESAENRDAGNGESVVVATTSSSATVSRNSGSGGRRGAVMVKSWRPTGRRTNVSDGRTMVPVLERAREWINATPKPSSDDWTGPVFPAREVVGVGSQNGSEDKDSPSAGDSLCIAPVKSPAKSGSQSNVDVDVGSPVSGGAVGRLIMLPGDVAKTAVTRGPRPLAAAVAVDAASELMYVVGGGDGRGRASVAAARPKSRQHGLPVNSVAGRPVGIECATVPASHCPMFDRQMLTSAVCSFPNIPRTGQYMTKRVCHLLPYIVFYLAFIIACRVVPYLLIWTY